MNFENTNATIKDLANSDVKELSKRKYQIYERFHGLGARSSTNLVMLDFCVLLCLGINGKTAEEYPKMSNRINYLKKVLTKHNIPFINLNTLLVLSHRNANAHYDASTFDEYKGLKNVSSAEDDWKEQVEQMEAFVNSVYLGLIQLIRTTDIKTSSLFS